MSLKDRDVPAGHSQGDPGNILENQLTSMHKKLMRKGVFFNPSFITTESL